MEKHRKRTKEKGEEAVKGEKRGERRKPVFWSGRQFLELWVVSSLWDAKGYTQLMCEHYHWRSGFLQPSAHPHSPAHSHWPLFFTDNIERRSHQVLCYPHRPSFHIYLFFFLLLPFSSSLCSLPLIYSSSFIT